MPFVELHARSAFNFLRGADRPPELVRAAAALGLPALGVCDRMGVYGAPAVHVAAQEVGLRPIVGVELLLREPVAAAPGPGLGATASRQSHGTEDPNRPFAVTALPVLVQTAEGYRSLCRLLTEAQLRAPKGRAVLEWSELEGRTDGLYALTGDAEGPLAYGWQTGGRAGLAAAVQRIQRAFPKQNWAVEIVRHQQRGEIPLNEARQAVAAATGAPLIASNAPAYAHRSGRRVLDVFTALRHHTTLDAAGSLLEASDARQLLGAAAMRERFPDLPEALAASGHLAEECTFTLENLGYQFPQYPVPEGDNADTFLRKLTWFGADQRYGGLSPAVRQQIEHELALIAKLGFAGYFLIVWDIVSYCRERGIMVQGRGSAANSAVCYSLGITAVDPVGGRLLFERFLSEGRRSWPDIDLDLPSGDRREEVIQMVYRRYGRHGAAMTANVITYQGRGAMREVGKVLGLPESIVDRFNALYARGDYPHTLELDAQVRQAGLDAHNPRHRAALAVFRQVVGLPRHLGQHSGGMIVCQNALSSVMPLENASMPGRVVAQWDKDACEDLGIIKIDLLGLGMMAVLADAVTLTQSGPRPVDIARIPKDDTATYDLLCRAETLGVFQVESRAQMATLPRMKPRVFYDLAIEVAIIRPGPIAGDLANPYLNRRNGIEPVTYIADCLQPVLERTLGVPLFQEQVLKMAMLMADYTASESEELRRALGFGRNLDRINRAKATLRAKLQAKNTPPEQIEALVNTVSSFALYGFPESHAISFALIAYASAYLKVHYAPEFYTALLNNQPMGFYAPATIIQEARRRGLRFRPPCIAASAWETTIEAPESHGNPSPPPTLRLGLQRVQGLNAEAVQQLLAERRSQPFRSLSDLRQRCPLDQDELRALARAGALNALTGTRRAALWAVERRTAQGDLFAHLEPDPAEATAILPEMDYWERICADFDTTGVTVGQHPMAMLRQRLPAGTRTARELETLPNDSRCRLAGAVICRQRPGTAKGVVFLSIEDETGIANGVVYPALFERHRLTFVQEAYLCLHGRIQRTEGTTHLIVSKAEPLRFADAPTAASHDFH